MLGYERFAVAKEVWEWESADDEGKVFIACATCARRHIPPEPIYSRFEILDI